MGLSNLVKCLPVRLGAYPGGVLFLAASLGLAPVLRANNRLGWKSLLGTTTLAYYAIEGYKEKKIYKTHHLCLCHTSLMQNKLGCLSLKKFQDILIIGSKTGAYLSNEY